MWQEAFVSAILRSIFQTSLVLPGLRRLDMISNDSMERRWLEAAGKLFWQGWTLGAVDGQSTATNVNNHLAQGLLRFSTARQTPMNVIELLRSLSRRSPEVNALLAQALLAAGKPASSFCNCHFTVGDRSRTRSHTDPTLCPWQGQ